MPEAPVGVLLINVGTPDAPETPEVRRYLRQFLSDPRVLDMNPVGRWLLLNLIILPRRPARSAEAYRAIWTEAGSPLLVHGRALVAALQTELGEGYRVELGMAVGEPAQRDALSRLEDAGCSPIVVAPLFPQYASSTTGTCVADVLEAAAERWNVPPLSVLTPFYDDPGFIEAFAAVAQPALAEAAPEHVLFSFHGLPERHVRKSDPSGSHCLAREDCCDSIGAHNRSCYRAQCMATARALAARLGLEDGQHSVVFQSRLGKTPWLEPYADAAAVKLAEGGLKRLAVICPSFVADCLETLEEIGIRMAEDFSKAGGETLILVPSLNAHPAWVSALSAMVKRTAGR